MLPQTDFNNVFHWNLLKNKTTEKSCICLYKNYLHLITFLNQHEWTPGYLAEKFDFYHKSFSKFRTTFCRVWQMYALYILFSMNWYVGFNDIAWKVSLSPTFKLSKWSMHRIWEKFVFYPDQDDVGQEHIREGGKKFCKGFPLVQYEMCT